MSVEPLSVFYPATRGSSMSVDEVPYIPQQLGNFTWLATNMRIDNHRWRTRWRWRELSRAQDAEGYDECHTQGALLYNPTRGEGLHYQGDGQDRIVESGGGKLFSLSITNNHEYCVEDISDGKQAGDQYLLAWMMQSENYVTRTDSNSTTMHWDGESTFFSPGYSRSFRQASKFPNIVGATAYADRRTWAARDDRAVYASDVLHQVNQTEAEDVLKYTDQSYDYTNVYFAPPAKMDDIVAMFPVINTGTETVTGESVLIAATRSPGMFGIRLGVNRTQWGQTPMVSPMSFETAPSGPYAVAVRDGDILFRTIRGGIDSFDLLGRERSSIGSPNIDLAEDISPLMDSDYEPWLIFASLINPIGFDRIMCTVSPIVKGKRRWHRGYVQANLNPQETRSPESFAWEGLKTLPPQMGKIVQFIYGRINFQHRVFALTYNPETGKKGLCELEKIDGDDILADGTRIPISWKLKSKRLYTNSEYLKQRHTHAAAFFRDITGRVTYRISARTSEDCDFSEIDSGEICLDECPDCGLGSRQPGESIVSLGKVDDLISRGNWVEFLVEGEGVASVDFALKSTGQDSMPEESVPVSDCPCTSYDPYKWHQQE